MVEFWCGVGDEWFLYVLECVVFVGGFYLLVDEFWYFGFDGVGVVVVVGD